MAQARLVAEALAAHGLEHEMVVVETEGDRRAPDTAWGEGAFVAAIERALLDGRADVAVHSAKDVPTDEDERLTIAAYLPREDARDALVVATGAEGVTLDELPAGNVVGTDSPRRTGFLLSRRPDLDVRPLHGNVDTRLRRLDSGEVDALVLAVAGLVRLGRADRITQRLDADLLPPAPGQGAIAVQVRAADADFARAVAQVDDRSTRLAVDAERAFLRAAGGGCRAPIGAMAAVETTRIRLLGGMATVDGQRANIDVVDGPLTDAPALAARLAARLMARHSARGGRPRVLVTRPADQADQLVSALAARGVEAVVVPAIEVELADPRPLEGTMARLAEYDWAVVTSANGARAVAAAIGRGRTDPALTRWAAVGATTARALAAAGIGEPWQPATATSSAIAAELPISAGDRVLLVRGSLADAELPEALRRRGLCVDEVTAYTTREAPAASRPLFKAAIVGGPVAAVLFASPSAVRGLLGLAGTEHHAQVLAMPAIAIGPTTAAAVRDAGFTVLDVAETHDAQALAELTVGVLQHHRVAVPA